MNYYGYTFDRENVFQHHGILGQKWGVRRFQNKDGTLTQEGKRRLSLREKEDELYRPVGKTLNKTYNEKQIMFAHGKDGSEITIEQTNHGALARILALGSEHVRQEQLNFKDFAIKSNGKNIGSMEIHQDSPTEVNGVWVDISPKYRGNGYATAILLETLHDCKQKGYKTFTLEVPGNAPDARHIYEKVGFVAGEQISDSNDIWGGLTAMKLDLTKFEL